MAELSDADRAAADEAQGILRDYPSPAAPSAGADEPTLCERLRRMGVTVGDAKEAAAEIERLRTESEQLRAELAALIHDIEQAHDGRNSEAMARIAAEAERDAAVANHSELLYAVARKYPGETRHETALRYIREREQEPHADAAREGAADKGSGDG